MNSFDKRSLYLLYNLWLSDLNASFYLLYINYIDIIIYKENICNLIIYKASIYYNEYHNVKLLDYRLVNLVKFSRN